MKKEKIIDRKLYEMKNTKNEKLALKINFVNANHKIDDINKLPDDDSDYFEVTNNKTNSIIFDNSDIKKVTYKKIEENEIPLENINNQKLDTKISSSFQLLNSESNEIPDYNNLSDSNFQVEDDINPAFIYFKQKEENLKKVNVFNEKIECENCKNKFYNNSLYENHLEVCFYFSDSELKNNNFKINKLDQVKTNEKNKLKSPKVLIEVNNIPSINRVMEEQKKSEENFFCVKCKTEFSEKLKFELHSNRCSGKTWHFQQQEHEIPYRNLFQRHNDELNPYHNRNNNLIIDSIPNVNQFIQAYNSFGRNSLQNYNREFNDPNLSYDHLLQLDENIVNPLKKECISQLSEEKITKEIMSKLSSDNKNCLICMDYYKLNDEIIRLPCLHFFHKIELIQWLEKKKSCPICRSDIEELLNRF